MNHQKTAICCIACQENSYIREWVEYHKNLGFDHIFIYDNNKSFEADEHFEDVINDYISSSYVTIINKRDIVRQTFQAECYNECYHDYKDIYDWILFIDCDEFLTLYKFDNISDFLNQEKFNDFHVIKFNWLSYNDNGNIYKSEGLVQDRFPVPSDITKEKIIWENRLLKSIVRGSLDMSKISIGIHTPVPVDNGRQLAVNISDPTYMSLKANIEKKFKWDYRVCFADGTESFDLCYPNCYSPDFPRYDDAVIKHYRTKSCQEYVETKAYRGFQDCDKKILNAGTYFYFNEFTQEKIDYFMSKNIEAPIFLISSDSTDLGEIFSTYAAVKFLIKDIPYKMDIYWKNNNYYKVKDLIKNTGLFDDVNFFPSTIMQDIKYLKTCGEYHYVESIAPYNKYVYEKIPFELGRNIKINGERLSWMYFNHDIITQLFDNQYIKNEVKGLYSNFDLLNTCAMHINGNTRPENICKLFSLYKNHIGYIIITDDLKMAADKIYEAIGSYNEIYNKDRQHNINVTWLNSPNKNISMELVNMYTFAICRVNFIDFSSPSVWMGSLLNNNPLADIIYTIDTDKIYQLLLPKNDSRYKNLEHLQ